MLVVLMLSMSQFVGPGICVKTLVLGAWDQNHVSSLVVDPELERKEVSRAQRGV